MDLIGNKKFINQIEEAKKPLTLGTNGSKLQVKTKATLPNYGKVWFSDKSITNFISLAGMASKYQVRYDSWIEDAFMVHTDTGIKRFLRDKDNLYKYVPKTSAQYNLVETIQDNMKYYTDRQIQQTKVARMFLHALGHPSVQNIKYIITINGIKNCPVTVANITLAEKIYGKDIATLKGKLKRTTPLPIINNTIAISKELIEHQKNVDLCFDLMHVNGLAFLHWYQNV